MQRNVMEMTYLTEGLESSIEHLFFKGGQKDLDGKQEKKEKKIRGPATVEARRQWSDNIFNILIVAESQTIILYQVTSFKLECRTYTYFLDI